MVKSPTIRDVARTAGVGVGTVSRVLNESPLVSEATRQKVQLAIEALDYRPSGVARRLSSGRGALAVGVIVPFFTRPAFVGRLQGVEAALAHSDYDLILYNVESPQQRDNLFQRIAAEQRVDGLITISLNPTEHQLEQFDRYGVPVVLLDARHPAVSSISIDDVDGGRQVAKHLIGLGHERIAYISDQMDDGFGFKTSRERLSGLRETMAQHHLQFDLAYHQQGEHGRHVAYRLAEALFDLPESPTAIFAASDTQAIGVMEAARARGLRIPQDISIVGYDDIELAEYVGLTTVHQPLYQSGVEAVNSLLHRLAPEDGPPPPLLRTLPVELIVRETTASPRQ